MIFLGQIQTFVRQITGELVIADGHITRIGPLDPQSQSKMATPSQPREFYEDGMNLFSC